MPTFKQEIIEVESDPSDCTKLKCVLRSNLSTGEDATRWLEDFQSQTMQDAVESEKNETEDLW